MALGSLAFSPHTHLLINPIASLLSSTKAKPLHLVVCDCYAAREQAMNVDKAPRVRPRRRVLSSMMLLQVCIGICACLTLVDSQNNDDFSGTSHMKLLKKTLVNLHDDTLEANKDLDLSTDDPADAARQVLARIGSSVEARLTSLFSKAKTPECRALIGEHYGYFINAIGTEQSMPFADMELKDTCEEEKYDIDNLPEGMHIGHVQNKTYQPPDAEYIDDPATLKLCYGILTHDNPAATTRLINVLYEEGHTFVIHVDAKESADETYQELVEYASTRDYVHVLPDPFRVRVNWGGFTMVNATLQILKYAFALNFTHDALDFHKFVHLASTSYPIASNDEIRNKLASFPLDANLMHVIMKPTNPHNHAWHYFVECDDALHRIYRLKPLSKKNGGIDLHTSSQWFVISREFALYLADASKGTFVHEFLEYVQHVVVADETFFGTVLRNTHFCAKHHNWNFLHLQFDRWESDLEEGKRDPRKCMMPSPDHCGRSPTTMTMDYMDILELTGDLFARKFVDSVDSKIKDVLDMKRNVTFEKEFDTTKPGEDDPLGVNQTFAGHGVLIVAKNTVNDKMPLCLGLGPAANQVRLVPCFHDWVPKTLASDWINGAVIPEETASNNRWEFNPCSSDGALRRLASGELAMIPGRYSPTGPRCMMKQMDGIRAGRCIDGDFGNTKPGGKTHVFPCVKRWHQFFSVGNGTLAPNGSLHVTIPLHIVRNLNTSDHKQEAHLCLGVFGRGEQEDFELSDDKDPNKDEAMMPPRARYPDGTLVPLKKWKGKQLVTTRCSNTDAVIEWLYVPYILEDVPDADEPAKEGDEEAGDNQTEDEL